MVRLKRKIYAKIKQFKNKFAKQVIKLIKPDNMTTEGLGSYYRIREKDKYFDVPYGYFYRAVLVGYLLKLIKVIVKSTKEKLGPVENKSKIFGKHMRITKKDN